MVFYHRESCSGESAFAPSVRMNRAGWYIAMECPECKVSNRESGYYEDHKLAMSDANLFEQGLPITNPRAEETLDEQLARHLKAAGVNPKPDPNNDFTALPTPMVVVRPDGAIDIRLDDQAGTSLHVRIEITPWGLIATTDTGFGSLQTEDGFLVLLPHGEHVQENMAHILAHIEETRQQEEITQAAQTVDTESMA